MFVSSRPSRVFVVTKRSAQKRASPNQSGEATPSDLKPYYLDKTQREMSGCRERKRERERVSAIITKRRVVKEEDFDRVGKAQRLARIRDSHCHRKRIE